MLNSIVVIVNASAGLGYCGGWSASLAEKFRSHGVEADILLAKNGEEMIARARQAVQDRVTVVVAGGGDGTINCVASQLVDSDTHLAVLALGTLNHFAKDMNIPLDLDEAVANAVTGKPLRFSFGRADREYKERWCNPVPVFKV